MTTISKKSDTTLKVENLQKEVKELKEEQSKTMADRIWEAIPINLRNTVFIFLVAAGGLGGGGSFMGYVNAANPNSKETYSVILEIREEQKTQGVAIQSIKTNMAIVKGQASANKEAGRINTEDIKKLLSK